jgi:uncharacterized protein YndB with AHSA1/START domain
MKQQVLVIRRTIAASREQVFDCLTAADKMSKWFYGMEVGRAKASVDLRPGGQYLIEMFNEKGENHRAYGVYLEIIRPEKLVFTWTSECFVTDTKVTIELFERSGGTELVLTHELPENMVDAHRQGWMNCLDHLEAFLNSGA